MRCFRFIAAEKANYPVSLLCRVLGLPLARLLTLGQDYGALTVLERRRGAWALRRLNERPML